MQNELERLKLENASLRAALTSIGEFCSDDRYTLGAIARLTEVRETAREALGVIEQTTPAKCDHDLTETPDGEMTKLECRKCGFHFWEAIAR